MPSNPNPNSNEIIPSNVGNRQIWFMSNRQPWTQLVIEQVISTKTRTYPIKIKTGSLVFLHASLQLWEGYEDLIWAKNYNIQSFPVGVVYGAALVAECGLTKDVMPITDRKYFYLNDGWCVAGEYSIRFEHITKLPLVPCRGTIKPVKRLPKGLAEALWGDDNINPVKEYVDVITNIDLKEGETIDVCRTKKLTYR